MPASDHPPGDLPPNDRPEDQRADQPDDMHDRLPDEFAPDDAAPADADAFADDDGTAYDVVAFDDADYGYDDTFYEEPDGDELVYADDYNEADLDEADYEEIPPDEPTDDAPPVDEAFDDRPPLWARWWARRFWFLFAAAFLTPLFVIGGIFVLVGTLTGWDETANSDAPITGTDAAIPAALPTATRDPNLTPEWSANVAFDAHTVPARIRHIFTAPGERHGYQFEGHVGDVWVIAVEPYQRSGTDPVLALYGPGGTRICQRAGCAEDASRSQITVILQATGTYRVVVSSASGASTGYYLLTLDDA